MSYFFFSAAAFFGGRRRNNIIGTILKICVQRWLGADMLVWLVTKLIIDLDR
jgi:hypothetical protein